MSRSATPAFGSRTLILATKTADNSMADPVSMEETGPGTAMDPTRPQEMGMDEAEEAGFVRAAQRGDRVAFLALARYYWRSVAHVVQALSRSPETAARRTLDVFEHAWKGLHFLPDGQRFYVWVHRIAFNLCQAGPARIENGASETPIGDPAQRCVQAFADLSAEHQQVLVLRLASRLDIDDVTRVLELTPAAAKERLSEARADLHSRWTGKDPKAGLSHFSLQQLSDYVGTEPASAPEFVRAHLGQCPDCRGALTALEAQERILTALFASVDPAGREPFLNEIVERIAGERHADRMGSSKAKTAASGAGSTPDATIASSVRSDPSPGSPATQRATSGPWIVVAIVVVVAALLGVQFGAQIEPWLGSVGIRWGAPGQTTSPNAVANVERSAPPSATAPDPGEFEEVTALPAPEAPAAEAPIPSRPLPPPSPRKHESAAHEKNPVTVPGKKSVAAVTAAPQSSERPGSQEAAAQGAASERADTSRGSAKPAESAAARPTPPPEPHTAGPRLVCGKVSDADGRAVEGAQVTVTRVDLVVLTDRWGRFCFSVPSGDRTLSVLADGFQPLYRAIGDVPTSGDVALILKAARPDRARP